MSQRTQQQNRSMHLAFRLLADSLNQAGLDQRKVLKPSVAIPWTGASVKQMLFKPIMDAMTTKKSTTELEKNGEIDYVWDTLMRHLGEKFGIEYIPLPSLQGLIDKQS
jgi:hypothetical protein